MTLPKDLPPPSPEARSHSQRLQELICAEIRANGGALDFARYMELALYAPGLGYYSAGSRKFGAAGDFVTAPEISPLFSRCLARQCRQILADIGGGDILEFGAGSGVMAADVLLELERLESLPRRYLILELSAELRQRQRETLAQRAPRLADYVTWLDTLPQRFEGVVLANEVLDAMPVHRVRLLADGRDAVLNVVWTGSGFAWHEGPVQDPRLKRAAAAIRALLGPNLDHAYDTEISLAAPAWVASVAAVLGRGAVLIVDYGFPAHEFYHPQRSGGTLMCHYRHRAHADPLILPGLQDLTAHLDFTAVAEAADAVGLRVAGYTTQAYFLLGCGLEALLAEVGPDDTAQYFERVQQVKKLTLPSEMGELFKVMALTRGVDLSLDGFRLHDQRARL